MSNWQVHLTDISIAKKEMYSHLYRHIQIYIYPKNNENIYTNIHNATQTCVQYYKIVCDYSDSS